VALVAGLGDGVGVRLVAGHEAGGHERADTAVTSAGVMRCRRVGVGSGIRRAVRSGRSRSVPPDAAAWVAVDNEQDLNRSEPLMPAGSPDPTSDTPAPLPGGGT
jgi:hypothetical protein